MRGNSRRYKIFPSVFDVPLKRNAIIHILPQMREWYSTLFLSKLHNKQSQAIYVVPDHGRQRQAKNNLCIFASFLKPKQHFEVEEINPHDEISLLRFLKSPKRTLWLVSSGDINEKVPTYELLSEKNFSLHIGSHCNISTLQHQLEKCDYYREYEVLAKGTYAIRGGIVDIFPKTTDLPLRIELYGNRIESLRLFSPETQLSLPEYLESYAFTCVDHDKKLLAKDLLFSEYLSRKDIFLFDNAECLNHLIKSNEKALKKSKQILIFSPLYEQSQILSHEDKNQTEHVTYESCENIPSFRGRITEIISYVKTKLDEGFSFYFISTQAERLKEIFQERSLWSEKFSFFTRKLLAPGWIDRKDSFCFLTDYELFGLISSVHTDINIVPSCQGMIPFLTLEEGCYVTHVDHGIGKFVGTTEQKIGDILREYFIIEFHGGDRIYVPTTKADRLTKYITSTGQKIELSSLNSKKWKKIKEKAQKEIDNYAKELLTLSAQRNRPRGFTYPPDDYIQKEIALSFPFMETSDQIRVNDEIRRDMESDKIMDRLVCGDVGFGKTEVALRAAVKAAVAGKQVVFLVPTTILAEQHYATFSNRLKHYPFVIEYMSRFRTNKDLEHIKKKLASGEIDIIIGTHRLLQKDIEFKDLGLLIIDEEQRFGVKAKELLKRKRIAIDVLALSATPIPRTLQLSLTGIRDISILNTPPPGRLPITTYVEHERPEIIRKAITQECDRGGQVFIVFNRVRGIETYARKIAKLVPEVTVSYAHGQMKAEELEERLYGFLTGKTQVLVTTTIIENGIDIPNANTIIVINANTFGISSLYQMRGRVGRSHVQAYAYFLYSTEQLAKPQEERLKSLESLTDLGHGLEIAMKDLDIRGAGTLFGTEQSGVINDIGHELYLKMIRKEIENRRKMEREKRNTPPSQKNTSKIKLTDKNTSQILSLFEELPDVDIPLSAYIPSKYISNTSTRLRFYQMLGAIESSEQLRTLQKELVDRFGKPPEEVINMFFIEQLRLWALQHGVTGIKKINDDLFFFCKKIKKELFIKLENIHEQIIIKEEGITLQKFMKKDWKKRLLSILTPPKKIVEKT